MGTAPAAERVRFEADLRAALDKTTESVGTKHQAELDSHFGEWTKFCESLSVDPSLRDVPGQETRLSYLLVYGMRYRLTGRRDHPVKTDQVEKALLAVGKGIADLGQPDPRKSGDSAKNHPLLADFLTALRNEDEPAKRAYPANLTIIRRIRDTLDCRDRRCGKFNAHILNLIIVAFHWLLRPTEYLVPSDKSTRSTPFRFQDINLTIRGNIYNATTAPLNDERIIKLIEHATLTFSDQKNAVKDETVGHSAVPDEDFFCPCKALGRIARRLRLAKAPPDTPIFRFYHTTDKTWMSAKPQFVTNALRHAAADLESVTGVNRKLLSARSLRPGGATALLCADIEPDHISLLGRWKSDAMFRYLQIQAATRKLSAAMHKHGGYTFSPSAYQTMGLPREAPPSVAALLAHDELYTD